MVIDCKTHFDAVFRILSDTDDGFVLWRAQQVQYLFIVNLMLNKINNNKNTLELHKISIDLIHKLNP